MRRVSLTILTDADKQSLICQIFTWSKITCAQKKEKILFFLVFLSSLYLFNFSYYIIIYVEDLIFTTDASGQGGARSRRADA